MVADMVLLNGSIYTMNPTQPTAQAVAVANGRIIAVGSDDEIRPLLNTGGDTIDFHGQTLVPGFIDAHLHFLSYGLALQEVDLVDVSSVDAAVARVRERASSVAEDTWITGRGWDQSLWAGGDFPSRDDLDRATQNHPVFLRRKCGHAGWANSLALEVAGINSDTADPPGGEIERDASGKPTGILKETAMELIANQIENPTDEQAVAAIQAAMANAHRLGIVGIHNMEDAHALRAYQTLRRNGDLKLRVVQQIPEAELDAAIDIGIQSGWGDDTLRIGALKIFSDGALGARTALMIEHYEEEPDNYGIAVRTAQRLKDQVEKAAHAGIAVHIHAIGDLANRNVLDAIESTRKQGIGLHLRHRIEHAQVLHPDDLPRFAELNVIASMQPIHCTQDMYLADAHWGRRSELAYAFRTILDSGAAICFGSDAPVEDLSILRGIHAAVTRRRADGSPGPNGWYPEQRLTVAEAVHAYTTGAAYSVNMEQICGKIAPGMTADFAILTQDIFTIEPDAILDTQVAATVFGGEFVYRSGSFTG